MIAVKFTGVLQAKAVALHKGLDALVLAYFEILNRNKGLVKLCNFVNSMESMNSRKES